MEDKERLMEKYNNIKLIIETTFVIVLIINMDLMILAALWFIISLLPQASIIYKKLEYLFIIQLITFFCLTAVLYWLAPEKTRLAKQLGIEEDEQSI